VVDAIKQGEEALTPAWESQNLLATRPAQGGYTSIQALNRCSLASQAALNPSRKTWY